MNTTYSIYTPEKNGRWAWVFDGYRTLEEAQQAIRDIDSTCVDAGRTYKIVRITSYEEEVEVVVTFREGVAETSELEVVR